MITTYVLEVEKDLDFYTVNISNPVFEFYTSNDELSSIQTDEWGKERENT